MMSRLLLNRLQRDIRVFDFLVFIIRIVPLKVFMTMIEVCTVRYTTFVFDVNWRVISQIKQKMISIALLSLKVQSNSVDQ